jgi:hypothetical protein
MDRCNETLLFWPLPIGLSFGTPSTTTLDLIIPAVFECHSIIHFDFIVIVVHAIDCLKRIRGDVGICCDKLEELVAAKGQDELDELVAGKIGSIFILFLQ